MWHERVIFAEKFVRGVVFRRTVKRRSGDTIHYSPIAATMTAVVRAMPLDVAVARFVRSPRLIVRRQRASKALDVRAAPVSRVVVGVIPARSIRIGILVRARVRQIHVGVARTVDPVPDGPHAAPPRRLIGPVPEGVPMQLVKSGSAMRCGCTKRNGGRHDGQKTFQTHD